MNDSKKQFWIRIAIIMVFGSVGVFSTMSMIPELIAISGQEQPVSVAVIQMVSAIQSLVLLFAMVMLGAWLSPGIGLGTPILDAWLNHSWNKLELKPIILSAVIGGVAGGIVLVIFYRFFIPYLPEGFVENANRFSPPLYTKLLYGGITEEILLRWGMMSFFVWGCHRLIQGKGTTVSAYNYVLGLLASALIFGIGHIPVAKLLSPVVTSHLLFYIVIGNGLFGVVAGYLYWKRGLESAILAHMLTHVVIVVGDKL